jgi:hypothetical protein
VPAQISSNYGHFATVIIHQSSDAVCQQGGDSVTGKGVPQLFVTQWVAKPWLISLELDGISSQKRPDSPVGGFGGGAGMNGSGMPASGPRWGGFRSFSSGFPLPGCGVAWPIGMFAGGPPAA